MTQRNIVFIIIISILLVLGISGGLLYYSDNFIVVNDGKITLRMTDVDSMTGAAKKNANAAITQGRYFNLTDTEIMQCPALKETVNKNGTPIDFTPEEITCFYELLTSKAPNNELFYFQYFWYNQTYYHIFYGIG